MGIWRTNGSIEKATPEGGKKPTPTPWPSPKTDVLGRISANLIRAPRQGALVGEDFLPCFPFQQPAASLVRLTATSILLRTTRKSTS